MKMKGMEGQLTLLPMFEEAEPSDKAFSEGSVVWLVTLSQVCRAEVTGTFEVKDQSREWGKTTRYRIVKESGAGGVFGKENIGETVFRSEPEASRRAEENLKSGKFRVIEPAALDLIEIEAWETRPADGGRRQYSVVALVRRAETWSVYRKDFCTYHFMEDFAGEEEARKAYEKERRNSARAFNFEGTARREGVFEAGFEPIALFGTGDGRWASCEYANNHYVGEGIYAA